MGTYQDSWARRRRFLHRLKVAALMTVLIGILALSLLAQTVFAKTYVITDGDRTMTHTSLTTDPARVLGEAGVTLSEHDTYTTQPGDGGDTITILRAQTITIEYHGKTTKAASAGETAGELLSRLGLAVTGEDVVSHGMEERTFDGMVLRVDRVAVCRETYSAAIPHDTTRCMDASLPEGTEEVLIRGVDGELLCTADVTYVNGQEVSRQILSQSLTRAPVTEILGVGTGREEAEGEGMPVIGDGYILLPTGEVLTYTHTAPIRATAYTHTDAGCDMTTATGTKVHWGTVAVDPRYIPYGTRMFIVSNDGEYVYGIAVAEDCGGAIKGDRMDLYMPTYEQCMQFGRRTCTLYFLG